MSLRQVVAARPYLELARKAKVDNDPAILQWIRGAVLSGDEATIDTLVEYLNFRAAEQLVRGLPFYVPLKSELLIEPTARTIGYGHIVGDVGPLVRPIDELAQHAAIFGSTGVGKTVLLRLIVMQALRHCVPWVFDREKTDYRVLALHVPELLVLDCRKDLLWNPLRVHGAIHPEQAIQVFVAVFAKSFDLLLASQSLLQAALHELHSDRGIFDGSNDYPTLHDLRAHVAGKQKRGQWRASQYIETVLNRVDGLLFESPQTYRHRDGYALSELAGRPCVFEIRGLNEHHARFLTTHLLTTLFQERLASGERGNILRTLAVVDESSWLAPPSGNVEVQGWSPLADLLRMGREAGIGLVLASQGTVQDRAILENVRTRFVFRLGNGSDVDRIKSALSLSQDQAEFLTRMHVGESVVGIPEARPFVLTVPEVVL